MRWPDVASAISTVAEADSTLYGLFGDNIRMEGSHVLVLPSLEYFVVSNVFREVMEPVVVQWNIFALSVDDLAAAEAALLTLFDSDLAVSIAGVAMFSEYIDGAVLEAPTGDNVYARALRFSYEAVRSALQRP